MPFWDKIKNHFSAKRLKREGAGRRDSLVVNFHNARSIGFLYHSKDEATFILVKQFAEKIIKTFGTRRTLALAYISAKEAPSYHGHILQSDYFTKKNLNWYGYPEGLAVETFCTTDFDILIDLSDGKTRPLTNILERSTARFKIGRDSQSESYDLIVPMRPDSTLDQYFSRIINLLSTINHESSKIA
jgi:hypothetical protein